ncbi:MAG: type II methionyl aminopeptidase [Methanobacteriota archaeon]|nr:MAG: type II methionyl aminopeptidase [Euryarchaeota archaeon]
MLSPMSDIASITSKVKKRAEELTKPGASLLELATELENYIVEQGARPAFPINISIGEIAAHYTPSSDETTKIGEKDLVKVDFGIELDGLISDNAVTFDFSGEHGNLVEAAEAALATALSTIKAGTTIKEVSKAIQDEIKGRGLKPIANLTGHKIEGHILHAGVSLPNVAVNDSYVFKEGDIFAVEPFVTTADAAGQVVDTDRVEIYSFVMKPNLRMRESRILLNYIEENYGTLPFAERWIEKKVPSKLLLLASLKELLRTHAIQAYPVLREANGKPVAQAEKTVVVEKDGVTTLV